MSSDSDSLPEHEVEVYDEETKHYPSYATASIASCHWVNSGKHHIDPSKLELYTSRLKKSVAYGKVVGVGLKPKPESREPFPYVRLDIDPVKGIHFNAAQLDDSRKKLAAVIQPTVHMKPAAMENLYRDYIKALENRSAEFIWEWWRTGHAPTH